MLISNIINITFEYSYHFFIFFKNGMFSILEGLPSRQGRKSKKSAIFAPLREGYPLNNYKERNHKKTLFSGSKNRAIPSFFIERQLATRSSLNTGPFSFVPCPYGYPNQFGVIARVLDVDTLQNLALYKVRQCRTVYLCHRYPYSGLNIYPCPVNVKAGDVKKMSICSR